MDCFFAYLLNHADAPDGEIRGSVLHVDGHIQCSGGILDVCQIRIRTAPGILLIAADGGLLAVDVDLNGAHAAGICLVHQENALALG